MYPLLLLLLHVFKLGITKKKRVRLLQSQIDEICKQKMADLNARDLEHARRLIAGTARSMGIEVDE